MELGSSKPSTTSSIHITILSITTLLILTILLLIIGPSGILTDSSTSTACTCTYPPIHLDTSTSTLQIQPPTPQKPSILNTALYDGTHLRQYKKAPQLTATNITSQIPSTWEGLLSPPRVAGGILITQESLEGSKFDAHPEIRGEESGPSGFRQVVAMMHQLHCLITIRGFIYPENNNVEHGKSSSKDKSVRHLSHCFEYLAQALICHADDTMEAPYKKLSDGKAFWTVDGEGAVHQCRDPRPILEMAMRSREHPMNLSAWNDGIGVREYFTEELKRTGFKHLAEMDEVFMWGFLGRVPDP
ncbi:hypothetical protein BJY04DRAFT_225016 [Aspergillus karnatakaensis]|uniref:uncharacterized protein n=1 Tax=Aspergillus karnatakaensis TaxID=1810916 RepID=UPI003CCD90F3